MKKSISVCIVLSAMCLTSACSTLKTPSKEENRNTKVAEINIQLGMAYLSKGDTQRSKQKFLYALQKAPQLPEAWYSMAYFLEQTGNLNQAKEDYLKAIEVSDNRGDTLNNYGTFLCRTGEYAEAVKYFVAATQDTQFLDNAGSYENAGLCALKIPDRASARKYFNLALQSDPSRAVSKAELEKLEN